MHMSTQREPKVVVVPNYKGGSGKSFTSSNLAVYLAEKGHHVLVVDCCSLMGQATSFNVDFDGERTLLAYVDGAAPLVKVTYRTWHPNIDLVPGHKDLIYCKPELRTYQSIQRLVAESRGYNYIVIDSAPNGDVLAQSALIAGHYTLVPVVPDIHATLNGLELTDHLFGVVQGFNPNLTHLGIYVTGINEDRAAERAIIDAVRRKYADRIIPQTVRYTAFAQHALSAGRPLLAFEKAKKAAATQDLRKVFDHAYARMQPTLVEVTA